MLTRLAELAADSSADDAAAINALRQQIQALKVTGRQKINLDPDIVRVAERGNPPLQGNYTLWVGPPPSTVTLFGLISSPGKQPFTPGRDVASYLSGQNLLSGADRSYAWVVYPDGRTQKAPVAYERGNPPLQGNYTLWVGPPPSTVTLFGLISSPGKQPFTPGRDVASYLSGQNLLSGADRSYAWVVYPDGRTQKAPVAYWTGRTHAKSAGGLLEQASRRADARQHYLCWPRGLRLE